MIWIICAILAIGLIALSLKTYLNKRNGSLRIVFALGFLFLAAYIVYIPAFFGEYDWPSGLAGSLINVLQMVTLDADVLAFREVIYQEISNEVFASCYMILVGVLHLAMPAISALTAVTVLFRCFSSMQLFFANRCKKPMFVFSERNERALQLAKSLHKIKCDIIFADTPVDSLNNENDSTSGFIFKEEGISELKIRSKKGKEIYLFCISDNEDDSLSHSLRLMEKLSQLPEEEQKHIHIYQFSRFADYAVFVDSANKGALDVQCINEYEMLVYNLLDQYPLFKEGKDGVHVLLHGLSPINIVALRAIAWCGQLSNYKLKISIVGVQIEQAMEDLKLNFPGLFTNRYDLRAYDCASEKEIVEKIAEHCADANYILVSEESDNETMNRGILLRRLFYKLSGDFTGCPSIFCYIQEPSKFNVVKNLATAEANPKRKMSYDLTPYGSLDEVYTYEKLVGSDLENLAKNVHLAYEEIFSDGEINVPEALKRYQIFEVNKRSNRANALHIRYKLNLLGLDYTTDETAEPVNMRAYYTEQMMDVLAYSEHNRWMAFLESEGWEQSTREEVLAYRESGISKGRHNCPILKKHPYICEYEKLEALSLELEGKDTTVYDRELILRIPDILGDKWNVAGKKYIITKLR